MTKYIVLLLIAAGCSNNHLKAANPERLENRISARQERLRNRIAAHQERLKARIVANTMNTMECQIDAFITRFTEIEGIQTPQAGAERTAIVAAIKSSDATLSFIAGTPRLYEKREPEEIVQRLTALLELSDSDD